MDAMKEVRLEDWLDAVSLTYERLHADGSPVALLGFCLGGALALRLARPLNPRALCLLATPAGPLPETSFPRMAGLRSTGKSVNDSPSAEVRRWRHMACHQLVPEAFYAQYQSLLKGLAAAARQVRCPILVAQSRGDGITPPADAERLLGAISGERRKLVWSRRAGHALPVDVGRRALFAEIAGFLEQTDEAAASVFTPRP
jgi:esterase/lipase